MNTAQSIELLAILVEELGEAAQAAGKALRFGLTNHNPLTGEPNATKLEIEIGDVLVAIDMLAQSRLIDMETIIGVHVPAKRAKLAQWLRHQKGDHA